MNGVVDVLLEKGAVKAHNEYMLEKTLIQPPCRRKNTR